LGLGKKAGEKIIEKGVSSVKPIINSTNEAFASAKNLKTTVQKIVSEKSATPQLKTSAERLFLQGTNKTLENPSATYEKYLTQSKKALVDIKADPAISDVGNKIGDAFNKVVAQRRAVGAKMGDELKKVGGIKTNIDEAFSNFETALKESDLTFNGKNLVAGDTSKMVPQDISMIEDYINELNKLGSNPTISQIDGLVGRTTAKINYEKSAKGIIETTNGERLIKGSLAKLREQFDPIKTGNKSLTAYSNARKAYSELSDFMDDGAGYLGKITQSGDFAKDASIAKSAVQSILNNGKKDWLARLEALTGYPALDESVLALQAMKDAGDFRGLSLLQAMSEGGVPTSKAGFVGKILDYGVKKGTEIVVGSPEEQTRAFLKNLGESMKVKTKPVLPK